MRVLPVLLTHSQGCFFPYNKSFSRTRGGSVNWKAYIFLLKHLHKLLCKNMKLRSAICRHLFDTGENSHKQQEALFTAVCLKYFCVALP